MLVFNDKRISHERREREWSRDPRFPPGPPCAIASVFFFTGCEVWWGGAGSKQGAAIWGDRGEWTVARPRRRKVFEQADGQWDRFHAVQRRARGWAVHQRRRSRSRVHLGSDLRYSDVENLAEFEPPVQTFDRKAVLQYSRSGRTRERMQRLRAEPDGYRTETSSREQQLQRRAWTEAGRGRSRYREAHQQPLPRKVGKEAALNERVHQQNHWQRDSKAFDNTGTGNQSFVSFISQMCLKIYHILPYVKVLRCVV